MGFRRAQMSDIARISGVAQGTLYLYTKSKEDLFWLALRRALGETLDSEPTGLALVDAVRQKLALSVGMPLLWSANEDNIPPLAEVLSEIYDTVERVAPAIRLVERCAQDWPELASMFYSELRPSLLEHISNYLVTAARQGITRAVTDPELAARVIVETIAWFAIHRHGDADGRFYGRTAAKAATIDALIHAYQSPEERKP